MSQGHCQQRPHLLHVIAGLRAGLDEHNAQFFGPLLPFLDGYLPGSEGEMEKSAGREAIPADVQEAA